jgi:hypothetical protein
MWRMIRNEPNASPRRPRVLLALTAFLTIFQVGAAVHGLQIPAALTAQVSLVLPLEFGAGLVWALVAGICFWRLWTRRRNARLYALWLVGVFSIYSLARLFLFTRADYDRGRLGFLTLAIIILLVYIGIRSFLFSRKHSMEIKSL